MSATYEWLSIWWETDEYKMWKPMYADEYGQIHKNFTLIKILAVFYLLNFYFSGERASFSRLPN